MSHEDCAGDGTPPHLPSPSAEGSRAFDRVHGNVPHEQPPPDTLVADADERRHGIRGIPFDPSGGPSRDGTSYDTPPGGPPPCGTQPRGPRWSSALGQHLLSRLAELPGG